MPVLADILANADSWKRRVRRNLSDLIDNPAGVMEQMNDAARNRNQNVVPVIQGGSLYNRPLTQEEKQERATQLAMDFMPGGVGAIAPRSELSLNFLRPENRVVANRVVANNPDQKSFKDYVLHYITDNDGESKILALKGDVPVGQMGFVEFDRKFHPDVFVSEAERRKGLSSAMYDFAREYGWLPDAPHSTRTEMGEAFRSAYDKKRGLNE
jgi:hypothetical protein